MSEEMVTPDAEMDATAEGRRGEDDAKRARLAEEINREHDAAEEGMRDSLAHARVAGEKLLAVKDSLDHGQFMAWRERYCSRISHATANDYMKIARHWDTVFPDVDSERARNLSMRQMLRLIRETAKQEKDNEQEPVEADDTDLAEKSIKQVQGLVSSLDACMSRNLPLIVAEPDLNPVWLPVQALRDGFRRLACNAAEAWKSLDLRMENHKPKLGEIPPTYSHLGPDSGLTAHVNGKPAPKKVAARVNGRAEPNAPAGARADDRKSLRVLSCVPAQRYHFDDKLEWAEQQIKEHKPDMLVLPQEWHGGIQSELFKEQGTTEKVAYAPSEIMGPYTELAKSYKVGIAVGALVDDPELGERRERIWIIDPDAGVTGWADKMMLPGYDHGAKGSTNTSPEPDFQNRARAFWCCGARVGVLFCWEAFSSDLWHYISQAQPDFVVSMVKFGVKGSPGKWEGWPAAEHRPVKKDGKTLKAHFGFSGDGGWIERLQMAAKWDLAAPIICSTNSWNLPKRAGAIAGQILPFEVNEVPGSKYTYKERRSTLYVSEGKGILDTDHVQVDDVDFMYWRHIRNHKTKLVEATGEWPSSAAKRLTMSWKIRRMARQFAELPTIAAEAELREQSRAS